MRALRSENEHFFKSSEDIYYFLNLDFIVVCRMLFNHLKPKPV